MFKKTLLALAVAATSTTVLAADIKTETASKVISLEGSASLSTVKASKIEVALGAEYTVGDILKFNFSGADLDADSAPISIEATMPNINDTLVLGKLGAEAGVATYRVTELSYSDAAADLTVADTTVKATVAFEDSASTALEFTAKSVLASGNATVTYSAETSTGFVIDNGGSKLTATIFTTGSQFSGSVSDKFDAVINVNEQRLSFVEANATIVTDTVTLTPKNTTSTGTGSSLVNYVYTATPTLYTYTVNGSFGFLDTDSTKDGVQTTKVTATAGGSSIAVKSVSETAIVVEHADTEAVTVSINISDKDGLKSDMALATQSFTADAVVAYTDHGTKEDGSGTSTKATKTIVSGADAGEWTLNGANVMIPYMPFGDNTAVIMRATNVGTQTGDLTVRYMLEGVDTAWNTIEVAVSTITPGVNNIRDAVMDAIKSDAGVTKGKVAIDLTVNAPADDIKVYAAYKVVTEQDRGFVGIFGG